MSIKPDHIPDQQEQKYKEELCRKGLLRIFVVAREPYDRYSLEKATGIELYEARNPEELVKELGFDNVDDFHNSNGDGSDFCTVSELIIPMRKGKKICKCKLKLQSVLK